MADHVVSRETLYARFDAFAEGRQRGGARSAYEALLDRVAANQRAAEAQAVQPCALERAGGMGRLRPWGVPPGHSERHVIPDWLPETR
jgi:hypothetical protein